MEGHLWLTVVGAARHGGEGPWQRFETTGHVTSVTRRQTAKNAVAQFSVSLLYNPRPQPVLSPVGFSVL